MSHVRSKDGTPIAFDRVGEGPAVVLVGGAFSYRAFPKMVELAELMADRFTVINFDRRGRGDSGDTEPYAVEREIEDLQALLDEVGGSASAWGWSSGAVLVLRAAAHGLELRRLALYEPPFMVDASHRLPPPDFAMRLAELTRAGRRSAAVRYYMRKGMGIPAPIVTLMRFTPFWSKLKAVAHTLPYDTAVMGDTMAGKPLSAPEWASVTAPALVIAGEKSPTQLRQAAGALAAVLPNAEQHSLEGQSHNPSMPALAPVLKAFFANGWPRGAE
ncbi:MAG TPA: alpha/beta hydrolase [Gaiellaceae bacterium]|nr:alpha/beta hydrolase [Gaiellaceae bacterium]HET8653321.1 alpha/beta hydrolase [Gaiellaceae bacterium]